MSLLLTGVGSTSIYSYYAQLYFNVVTANGGTLTNLEKTYINTFINDLGSDFLLFDRIWIFGLSNKIAAKISLVNPTSTIITEVNSPTFTSSFGFNGDGATSYLDLNYNPVTNGINYTLNSASLYVYSRTNLNAFKVDLGHNIGANKSQLDIRDAGSFFFQVNDNIYSSRVVADSLALFSAVRSGAAAINGYKRGVILGVGAVVSTSMVNNNMFACANNNNGTPNSFSPRQLSNLAIGGGTINQLNYYNSLQTLGTSIGWAV